MESKLGERLAGAFGLTAFFATAVFIGATLMPNKQTESPPPANSEATQNTESPSVPVGNRAEGIATIFLALIPAAIFSGLGYGIGYTIDTIRKGSDAQRKQLYVNAGAILAFAGLIGFGVLILWLTTGRNN